MRENEYPHNPHYPGTLYAAWWDLGTAWMALWAEIIRAAPVLRSTKSGNRFIHEHEWPPHD